MNNSALPVHLTSEYEGTIVKIGFYFERHKKKFQLNAKEFNLDATKIVKQFNEFWFWPWHQKWDYFSYLNIIPGLCV